MCGVMLAAVNFVAEPKRCHAAAAMAKRIAIGSHVPIAPRLCSHLPTESPMTFRNVASAKPSSANNRKYVLLLASDCQLAGPIYSALLAAK